MKIFDTGENVRWGLKLIVHFYVALFFVYDDRPRKPSKKNTRLEINVFKSYYKCRYSYQRIAPLARLNKRSVCYDAS
jgi:hypothetical protein